MEPAFSIVEALGGNTVVASRLGLHRSRVWNWSVAKAKGGTGGSIPQKYHSALLEFAAEKAVSLQAADFLPRSANVHPPRSKRSAAGAMS